LVAKSAPHVIHERLARTDGDIAGAELAQAEIRRHAGRLRLGAGGDRQRRAELAAILQQRGDSGAVGGIGRVRHAAAIVAIPEPLLALDLVDLVEQRDRRGVVDGVDEADVFAVGADEGLQQQLVDAVERVLQGGASSTALARCSRRAETGASALPPGNCSMRSRSRRTHSAWSQMWRCSALLSLPQTTPGVFALPATAALRAVAAELRQRIETRDVGGVQHTGAALIHLAFATGQAGRLEAVPERLRRVFNGIEQALAEPLTNDTLAAQAGMSVEAFIRWFKGRTGRTPAAFVAERRIREACRLLAFGESSIEQVAEAVGFSNRHHFSRVFKRYAGCGPAAFRRGRGGAGAVV
jgi:AraC-like DNA-binding protein